jgi:acetyl-CoA C-acetyltransferase
MRSVSVAAVGMTKFGRYPKRGIREMGEEAIWRAISSCNISPKEIEEAYCGNASGGAVGRQWSMVGQMMLQQVGITGIPVTRVETVCCSGGAALREAWRTVATGLCDVVLAVGVEKMSDRSPAYIKKAMGGSYDEEFEGRLGMTGPLHYSMTFQRHSSLFGTKTEHMAKVVIKSRRNASHNPYACFRDPIGMKEYRRSPVVSDPIRIIDATMMSDGAAAAILVPTENAHKFTDSPVRLAASTLRTGSYEDDRQGWFTPNSATVLAAKEAYKLAGVEAKDIDVAEVHDCFSIAEIIRYEDLGFCERGKGGLLVDQGQTEIDGKIPVNPSGGLLSKSHPIGATGIAQIAELFWQLRGEANGRQVKGAEVGLAHTQGGQIHADSASASVQILRV